MFIPRKVKYRKHHRGKNPGNATRGTSLDYGSFGLKATTTGLVKSREIEAARRAMTRYIQRGGKIWVRIFADHPATMKGAETPMGSGKGSVDHYVSKVQPGRIIFEMDGIAEGQAREAMRLAAAKLSVRSKFITK